MSPGPFLNTGIFRTRITDNDLVGPVEELGVWRYEAGKILRYVKSGALIPRNEAVRFDSSATTAALIGNQVLQVSGRTNVMAGIADNATFASLSFGWITVAGPATARVADAAIVGSQLGPSANTGVLADSYIATPTILHFKAVALAAGLSSGSAIFLPF